MKAPVILNGVALLAAQTSRSQAYIQTLIHHGLYPEMVLVMGPDPGPKESGEAGEWQGIYFPDLRESVDTSCARAGIPVARLPESDVNNKSARQALSEGTYKIAIYSGVGGQIVSAETLSVGARFLHMHSGMLPDYRGSTTLYYALLNGDDPGVTAIFLDECIDTGPIVARRSYPCPPSGVDIDQIYDGAIRADLLARVLPSLAGISAEEPTKSQSREDGNTYYVIHPVLKHLAILSIEAGRGRNE